MGKKYFCFLLPIRFESIVLKKNRASDAILSTSVVGIISASSNDKSFTFTGKRNCSGYIVTVTPEH
jgi:hypothetical protein